jgi:hypothetical protein
MRLRDGADKRRASNFVQISESVRQKPWQCLDEHSEKKEWVGHGKSKFTQTEKGKSAGQSQEFVHHFL